MADTDENMVGNAVEPRENGGKAEENDAGDLGEVEEVNEEEFKSLNDQIDQLNLVLDSLESKNDNIHAELMELLKSNKEARKQFQECQNQPTDKGEAKP